MRYHTGGPLAEPPLTGLNPFAGRHDAALRAGLLSASRGLAVPAREVTAAEKVAVPIGATGIIVGTTASGHPLLVDLADPTELATVTISGEFALLVQVALRRPQPATRSWCAPIAPNAGSRSPGPGYRWSARQGWPSSYRLRCTRM